MAEVIEEAIEKEGITAAIDKYHTLKNLNSIEYIFNEGQFNSLGYRLLSGDKVKEALEIFKLNVEMFPESSNGYDGLGEAYMAYGDKESALKNYKKSLELNPDNTNAREKLKELEKQWKKKWL